MKAYYARQNAGTPKIIVELDRANDETRYISQKPLVAEKRLAGTGELVVIGYGETNTPLISCSGGFIDIVVPASGRFREVQKTLNGKTYSLESTEERFSNSRFKIRELEFRVNGKT